jgi:hypothetical protein
MKVTFECEGSVNVIEFNEHDASHVIRLTDTNGELTLIRDKKTAVNLLRQVLVLVATCDDEWKKQHKDGRRN